MKKSRLIFVCLLTGLVVICGVIYVLRPPEPRYQGKSLSVWLAETDTGSWPRQSSNPADEAIRHIGTNAFPMIARLLRSRDSALKLKLLQVSYKLPFLHLHITTQYERHHRAIAACLALGPVAKPLVPEYSASFRLSSPSAILTQATCSVGICARRFLALRFLSRLQTFTLSGTR